MLDRFKVPEEFAVRVDATVVQNTIEQMFVALGVPKAHATAAADVLIYADRRGIDSHGISNMMRKYVDGLQERKINPTPKVERTEDSGGTIAFDCDEGLGVALSPEFMQIACDRAKDTGISLLTAYNGRHYGACAYYAQMALDQDLIGISMTAGKLLVAPTHGAEPLVGLNPLGVAFPSDKEIPFIFDASMSSVAANKIDLLQRMGRKVLPGWVSTSDGEPIMNECTEPEGYLMLPLGGTREIGSHKGFGLAMMIEILCGVMLGTGGGPHRRQGVGHLFIAIDIKRFAELELFKRDMDEYLRSILDCKPAPGETRVVYPGVFEHEMEIERSREGIPYHSEVMEWLRGAAEVLGVSHDLPTRS